jgi:uncharacterized protein YihD (DUF1040 family)
MDRRHAIKNIALTFGLTVATPTLLSLIKSCAKDTGLNTFDFFNRKTIVAIEFLIDIILPITTTVGGKDLNLAMFVDKIIKNVLNDRDQKEINMGLEEFVKHFEHTFNKKVQDGNRKDYEQVVKTYFDVPDKRKTEVFKLLQQNFTELPQQSKKDYVLYKFLTSVREFSMLGYYTSQTIVEGVLADNEHHLEFVR